MLILYKLINTFSCADHTCIYITKLKYIHTKRMNIFITLSILYNIFDDPYNIFN